MGVKELAHDPDSIQSRVDIQSQFSTVDLPDWICSHLELPDQSHVIDLGCAEGSFANQVLNSTNADRYTGIDRSEQALQTAQQKPLESLPSDSNFVRADFNRTLPFIDLSADVIFAFFSIYYASSMAHVCEEMLRLLAPSGRIVVVGPASGNKGNLYNKIHSMREEFDPLSLPAEGFLLDLAEALRPLEVCIEKQTVDYQVIYPSHRDLRAYLEATMIPSRQGWTFLQDEHRASFLNELVERAFENSTEDGKFPLERSTAIVKITPETSNNRQ